MSHGYLPRPAFRHGLLLTMLFVLGHGPANLMAQPPAAVHVAPMACGCRDHIYIFMINGLTLLPHVYGSMRGVGTCIEECGFRKPRVASHYWRWAFQREIRRLRCEDPQARFVLVGYSIGGSVVHSMAKDLADEGIFIDLLVYIDAHSFIHDLGCRPGKVGRVMSINSTAWILPGKCRPGQECYQVATRSHLATPSKEETLRILTQALNEVASTPVRPGAN